MTSSAGGRRIRGFWSSDRKYEAPNYDNPYKIYFTRWRIIETPWFGVFIHRFNGPDPRTTLHDHSWNSLSIRLRGKMRERVPYDQEVPVKEFFNGDLTHVPIGTVWMPRIKYRPAWHLHAVDRVCAPVWTLFFVGRKQRVWGYMDSNGTWTEFHNHPHAVEHRRAVAERSALIRTGMAVYVEDSDAG